MNYFQKQQYRTAIKSFIDLNKFTNPFSVTLTLKQSVLNHEGPYSVHTRIDRDKAIQNFRHFMNLMNSKVYGHSSQRHGTKIQVIPLLEGDTGTSRLHYHCIIDCPRPSQVLTFPSLIKDCWMMTNYGYKQIDVQRQSDNGWVDYITKFRGKSEYDQSIDWSNFHQI